jgi:6-phosphogluconate dehydrogenase
VFTEWNKGDLDSFLVEITAQVLRQVDAKTGKPLVDVIVDEAEQKGTGRWTVKSALDLGVPVTGIAEAVFARALSGSVAQRQATTGLAAGDLGEKPSDADKFIEDVRQALYASKIVAYAQGFNQIQAGSAEYDWGITPGDLATIWRGGCIIRAKFLNRIKEAFDEDPNLPTLITAPYFRSAVENAIDSWRRVVVTATQLGIPIPGFSSALSYYDALRTERLPAALIQGLRDFFGAHTYARTDVGRDQKFHTLWSGDRSEVPA